MKKHLKQKKNWLKWSQNLVTMQGGWIMWDGDAEERVEREVRAIESELNKRENESRKTL